MIARPTIGFGIGMVLISFFATSNAGMLSEIKQKLKQIINIFYVTVVKRILISNLFLRDLICATRF